MWAYYLLSNDTIYLLWFQDVETSPLRHSYYVTESSFIIKIKAAFLLLWFFWTAEYRDMWLNSKRPLLLPGIRLFLPWWGKTEIQMTVETLSFKLLPEPGCVLLQIFQFSPWSIRDVLKRLRVIQGAVLSLETSSSCCLWHCYSQ